MPEFLEKKLRAEYGNNARAIYGTMNKLGAMHGNKETAKGRAMEKKHEADMKSHHLREMRIEVHHGKDGKVTGHTVHHHMQPKKTGKSGAFVESENHSFPFGASQHKEMLAHVHEHLGGGDMEAPDSMEDDGSE